jgi:hypothetical protein
MSDCLAEATKRIEQGAFTSEPVSGRESSHEKLEPKSH